MLKHFGNPRGPKAGVKPDYEKFSVYFNQDYGAGAYRGIYLQGNESVREIFAAWMEPLHDLGCTAISIQSVGSTDHESFNDVGLPGFQFIQDEIEYNARTHHSNMDMYERIQEADMRQNAVIVAAFAYNAANRDEKLPRKPLPKAVAPARTTTTSER